MVILGIDPGTAITGFGLIAKEGNHLRQITFGVIRTSPDIKMPLRLRKIHQELRLVIEEYRPDVMAVEQLFFNKNVRTALAVGQARGVVLMTGAEAGLEIIEYTPLQVKTAVVGYGRAEKVQVQEMVRMLLCLREIPKPDDAADALAIAICHAHSCKRLSIIREQ